MFTAAVEILLGLVAVGSLSAAASEKHRTRVATFVVPQGRHRARRWSL